MSALEIRRATDSDIEFVVRSWVSSFRKANAAGIISDRRWIDIMAPEIRSHLARPKTEILVAAHPEATPGLADVYGWLAHERGHPAPFVLYCYVKDQYRRLGVARKLFDAAQIDPELQVYYACETPMSSRLRRRFPRIEWRPKLIRIPPPKEPS